MTRWLLLGLSSVVFAAADFNAVADNIIIHLTSVKTALEFLSFAVGLLFLGAAIFKFKQHKDNPTQTTVGNPMMYLLLAVLLMYLGNVVDPLGETLFAGEARLGKFE